AASIIGSLKNLSESTRASMESSLAITKAATDYLFIVCEMWVEALYDLLANDDAIFRARIQKILEFVAYSLPAGVGHALHALRFAVELYAIRKERMANADEYLEEVEAFIESGNVWLNGVLGFAAQCQTGTYVPLATPELRAAVSDLISTHIGFVRSKY